jgi:LPXTG-motif cell wall-anchored protein
VTGPDGVTVALKGGVSSVKAGGKVTVTATNLQPHEPVEVWIHSTPILLARGVASATGTYTVTVQIPKALPPGEHTIEVRGLWTGSSTSVPVTVTAASGTLAATGAQIAGVLALAIGLLGTGTALVLYRRREAMGRHAWQVRR